MSYEVEPVGPICELSEAPFWDEENQCLYYVDLFGKEIHKFDPATGEDGHTQLDGRIGFIIPVKGTSDLFVVAKERDLLLITWDGKGEPSSKKLLAEVDTDDAVKVNRFNDGKCDPKGHLWAGTMGPEVSPGEFILKNGTLYSFERIKEPKKHVQEIDISNGMEWSVDGKIFYFIDSLTYSVEAFDYNSCCPAVKNRRLVFDVKANDLGGTPDGLTIDSEGKLWVALFDGGAVVRFDPESGEMLTKIDIPSSKVTSVAFGGANLDELYVTTAWHDMTDEERIKYPLAGSMFRINNIGVKGLPSRPVLLKERKPEEEAEKVNENE